jgi:hypothetical protein
MNEWQGKPKNWEKTCLIVRLPTPDPTLNDQGSNPVRRGGTIIVKVKLLRDMQNYWGSGLYRSSRILNTGKFNVSKTESASFLR